MPTDARPELLEVIRSRFKLDTLVFDAEKDLKKVLELPKVDIIHCYGLLYHIQNPKVFLQSIAPLCNILLLETCVSSDHLPLDAYIVDEDKHDPTQAISGKGCRPSRLWIENILKENFDFVYYPKTQPDHEEFPIDWNTNYENSRSKLIRSVFIASKSKINNVKLTEFLPKFYEK